MTSYDRSNFFEKLGAFVPGYKGYSEKEMRRETDRILRDTIITRLQEKKSIVDDTVKDLSRRAQFDALEDLNSINSRIDQITSIVRNAPQGYSGFFDTVQIQNEDLDKLYRYDLGIRDGVEEFGKLVSDLPSAADKLATCRTLLDALQKLRETVNKRSEAITEVA